MTTRTTLLALAERVEAATGADRELDAHIGRYAPRLVALLGRVPDEPAHGCAPYTASIDAAMRMVPDGLSWTLGQNVHHKYWLASVNYLDTEGAPACAGEGFSASTPALALTAAALRALAERMTDAS